MMLRKASLAVLTAGLILGVTATGGLSEIDASREMTVSVVDDDEAYIGYDSPAERNVTAGEEVTLLTVTNRLQTEISVTEVTVDSASALTVDVDPYPTGLGPGEAETVEATIECSSDVTATPTHVTVSVEGTEVSATVFGEHESRTIQIECHA